jgi:hypothetical protein
MRNYDYLTTRALATPDVEERRRSDDAHSQ